MPQLSRVSGVKTSIYTHNDWTVVRYHRIEVVRFNVSIVVLNSGGWQTVTTKNRMNQASNQFGLGYYVIQKKGVWTVHVRGGAVLPFVDGMTIRRTTLDKDGVPRLPNGETVLDHQQ